MFSALMPVRRLIFASLRVDAKRLFAIKWYIIINIFINA